MIVVNEKAVVPYVEVLLETASEKYGWLNNATVWALDQEQDGHGTLNYWQVCVVIPELGEGRQC